ncbi:hypothetical protein [Rhodococcus sp. BS-15]|uniref:hypothetical protein n=1 Tax=Rhodococcus sp. BS-15 TaxID=1304954 RepID=UPI000B15AA9F|nr:hypothetical protein [Rhodococcus sp. BS-15]
MRTDEVHSARDLMTAIVTTGIGGYDKLVVSEVPRPMPGPGEVLVRVLAAGMNNTEINTRMAGTPTAGGTRRRRFR